MPPFGDVQKTMKLNFCQWVKESRATTNKKAQHIRHVELWHRCSKFKHGQNRAAAAAVAGGFFSGGSRQQANLENVIF